MSNVYDKGMWLSFGAGSFIWGPSAHPSSCRRFLAQYGQYRGYRVRRYSDGCLPPALAADWSR